MIGHQVKMDKFSQTLEDGFVVFHYCQTALCDDLVSVMIKTELRKRHKQVTMEFSIKSRQQVTSNGDH